jgi:hypothetical protein
VFSTQEDFMKLVLSLVSICVVICFGIGISGAQERAPATPLITHDPYFSVWSNTDNLADSDTMHWTGRLIYHMRAQIVFSDGATFTDTDHIFNTGQPPQSAVVTATTTAGDTPQPGIEMFDTLRPHEGAQAFATDLNGNVIWTYSYKGSAEDLVQPIKMLPNGHFLVQIYYASSIPVEKGTVFPGTLDELREVDLVGNTIRSITRQQIAATLAAQAI